MLRKLILSLVLLVNLAVTSSVRADAAAISRICGVGGFHCEWAVAIDAEYGTAIAQSLIPSADNTYDVGSVAKSWRDGHFERNFLIGGTLGVTGLSTLTGGVALNASVDASRGIRTATTDGADNQGVFFTAGGADATDGSRGARVQVTGNEATGGVGGALILASGTKTTESKIYFSTSGSVKYTLETSGILTQDPTNGGGITLTKGSTAVAQPIVVGISAAGVAQGDATALTGVFNEVTTTAAGTGVRMWDNPAGSEIFVVNKGANALLLYPPSGGTIYGQALNAGASIASAAFVRCIKTAALLYSCTESAVS